MSHIVSLAVMTLWIVAVAAAVEAEGPAADVMVNRTFEVLAKGTRREKDRVLWRRGYGADHPGDFHGSQRSAPTLFRRRTRNRFSAGVRHASACSSTGGR